MSGLPSKTDLILVAILPSPRDMEIARMLGWYRIPLRSAPKVVAVDHIAFYQPASFGEDHRWQIEYVAPVIGHELLTRGEMLADEIDHPHADQEYFKLQLGEITQLPNPVPAGKWKRINFIYTTGERLMRAESINDLGVHDEERQILWRALRDKAIENNQYGNQKIPKMAIEPDVLMMLGMGLPPQDNKKDQNG